MEVQTTRELNRGVVWNRSQLTYLTQNAVGSRSPPRAEPRGAREGKYLMALNNVDDILCPNRLLCRSISNRRGTMS
jgi:hypothetical protein